MRQPLGKFRLSRALPALTAVIIVFMTAPAGAAPQYTLKVLHAFCKFANCTDGNLPYGALLLDQSGDVFGATGYGGKYDYGTVFKLVPDGTRYLEYILHNFCKNAQTCEDFYPQGDLIADKNGVLYGVAGVCGEGTHSGSIFSLTHGARGWSLSILHTFNNDCLYSGLVYQGLENGAPWDGSSPLFGAVSEGGKYDNGYIYELKPSGWIFSDIHDFETSEGPNRPLVDSAGNVFGTVVSGGKYYGGLMYKLAAGTWKVSVLKNFCSQAGCPDGQGPYGELLMDANGDLFTATAAGGLDGGCSTFDGCGVIFERTAGGAYKVLYTFCSLTNCADGATPEAGLIMDSAGHIFGTTAAGGAALHCADPVDGGCGIAFELTQNTDGSWSEAVLHPFCNSVNCADGGRPYAPLVLDGGGDLFGTAEYFGAHGDYQSGGTVFELIPQ